MEMLAKGCNHDEEEEEEEEPRMIVNKKKILSNQGVEFSIKEGGNGPRKIKTKNNSKALI